VSVCHEEHVDSLLEGLSSNYASVISVIESKKCTPSIAEIGALLYGHETRLVCYNKETQGLSSPSLKYTQGYLNSNSYLSGDSGGSQGLYGRGGGNHGGFADRGDRSGVASHNSGGSNRDHSDGKLANFQCQSCLKYGHTANVCHFRSDMSFQPHESLTFFDPAALQPIPYYSGFVRTSNT